MPFDNVRPGSFCRIGTTGSTLAGTPMECVGGDGKRGRWRMAPGATPVSRQRKPRTARSPVERAAAALRPSEIGFLKKQDGQPYDGPMPRNKSQMAKLKKAGLIDENRRITDQGREALKLREPAPAPVEQPAPVRSVDDRIREACKDLETRPGGPVALADLRDRLPDVPRADLDKALRDMDDRRETQLEPDPDRGGMTQRDRDAALPLWEGGTPTHTVRLRDQTNDTAPPIEQDIEDAYRKLAAQGSDGWRPRIGPIAGAGYVPVAAIRDELGDRHPRADVDAAFDRMIERPDTRLQGSLLPLDDRENDGAVLIGNEPRHVMRIEDRSADADVDWSEYSDCGSCIATIGQACRDLGRPGSLNATPHPGRSKVATRWSDWAANTPTPVEQPAPVPAPAATGRPDADQVRETMKGMTDTASAEKYIDDLDLSRPELKALADDLGIFVPSGANKKQLRGEIVQWTCGRRLASEAIRRPNLRDVGPAGAAAGVAPVDRSADAGVDWSQYRSCGTCGTGPGEPCFDLRGDGSYNATPHDGRERASVPAEVPWWRYGYCHSCHAGTGIPCTGGLSATIAAPHPGRPVTADDPPPADPDADPNKVAADVHDVLTDMRRNPAYDQIGDYGHVWMSLDRVRSHIRGRHPGYSRDQVDQALRDLAANDTIHLDPEANQKILTEDDWRASLRMGGQQRHLVTLTPPPDTRKYEDRSADAGTDWDRYDRCPTCSAGPAFPCYDQTNRGSLNATPHPGRPVIPGHEPAEDRIRGAYNQLAGDPGDLIPLAQLRAAVPDVPKEDFDQAVKDLAVKAGDAAVEEQTNQKTLTQADRDAAVHIGGRDQHLLGIDPGWAQPTPPRVDRDPVPFDDQQAAAVAGRVETAPDRGTARQQFNGLGPDDTARVARMVGLDDHASPDAIVDRLAPNLRAAAPTPLDPARLNDAPESPNQWGGFAVPGDRGVMYHPDGPWGDAVRNMPPEAARIDVDGLPLRERLNRIASDSVAGVIPSQQAVDRVREIRDRLPDGPARRSVDRLVNNVDGPPIPVPDIPAGTPEPLAELVRDLHRIPLCRREPDRELAAALDACRRGAAGRLGSTTAVELAFGPIRRAHHESHSAEGRSDVERALQKARTAMKALLRGVR